RGLAGARQLRIEQLVRQHGAELERDPRGELVVRAEVVAIDITDAALALARKAQFEVLRTHELADLGVKITVLHTPHGMSASRGLKKLRKLDAQGTYDFNHVYLESGESETANPRTPAADPPTTSGGGVRVGLIDGGIDANHVSLRANVVHTVGCDGAPVPSA